MTTDNPRLTLPSAAAQRAMSRRRFLGASAFATAGVLAGCSVERSQQGADLGIDSRLNMRSWTEYIDPSEDGEVGTIERVESEFDMQINYVEDYEDNAAEWAGTFADLGAGQDIGVDIIVPTNWVAARLIDRGWVEPIPLEIVPNHANIDPSFLTPSWDRGARFHMPWQVGITGIAYNQELTGGEIRSLAQIFDGSADFAVGFIPEMREALGLAMLLDGADPSRPTEVTANAAMEHLEAAFRREQVRFTYDFRDGLQDGSLAAAMSWSGDVVQMQRDFPNIEFVIPDEGAVQWFDTMVIPQSSGAVGAAGKFMNYVYDPVNAARITNWVQYISPVVGVQDALVELGADAAALAENEILFPAIETRRRLFSWGSLDTTVEEQLEARFDLLIA